MSSFTRTETHTMMEESYSNENSSITNQVGPDAITSAFLQAMDSQPKTSHGEKNHQSLTEWGTDDQRVAFDFKLVRGLTRSKLQEFVRNVIAEARKRGVNGNPDEEVQGYVDLFCLMFNVRDIDEGKGERQLFYWYLIELHKFFPETVQAVLPLIPAKYGSWKDIKLMLEILQSDIKEVEGAFRENPRHTELKSLESDLITMYQTQLVDDKAVCEEKKLLKSQISRLSSQRSSVPIAMNESDDIGVEIRQLEEQLKDLQPSLCAKWIPREGRHFSWLAKRLAKMIFGNHDELRDNGSVKTESLANAAKKLKQAQRGSVSNQESEALRKNIDYARRSCYKRYRKLVSGLNREINTVEILMCDPEGKWKHLVPSAIPARCLKIHRKAFFNKTKTGEMRSTKEDRKICANNFVKHIQACIKDPTKKRVHGKNLQPHEMIKEYFTGTSEDDLVLEAQWIDLRERLKESGALGYAVTMVDTSGSMSGTPMYVAVGMGILISEVCHPAFQNRFLTFSSKPVWHTLNPEHSLRQKVGIASNTNWGMNTDFGAALNLVLQKCVEHKVPKEEVSKITLFILSDMQFDDAGGRGFYGSGSGGSSYQNICDAFKAAGYVDEYGEAITPHMVMWNLRGDTLDFPAKANSPNLSMVSGFSSNALKAFMDGDLFNAEDDYKPTPYDGFRKTVDSERYHTVRMICEAVGEGRMSEYVAPSVEQEEDQELVDEIDSEIAELEAKLSNLKNQKK